MEEVNTKVKNLFTCLKHEKKYFSAWTITATNTKAGKHFVISIAQKINTPLSEEEVRTKISNIANELTKKNFHDLTSLVNWLKAILQDQFDFVVACHWINQENNELEVRSDSSNGSLFLCLERLPPKSSENNNDLKMRGLWIYFDSNNPQQRQKIIERSNAVDSPFVYFGALHSGNNLSKASREDIEREPSPQQCHPAAQADSESKKTLIKLVLFFGIAGMAVFGGCAYLAFLQGSFLFWVFIGASGIGSSIPAGALVSGKELGIFTSPSPTFLTSKPEKPTAKA